MLQESPGKAWRGQGKFQAKARRGQGKPGDASGSQERPAGQDRPGEVQQARTGQDKPGEVQDKPRKAKKSSKTSPERPGKQGEARKDPVVKL